MGNDQSQSQSQSQSVSQSQLSKSASSSASTNRIILNVYIPRKPQSTFVSVYHTGIELNGSEYYYAGGTDAKDNSSGISTQIPRIMPIESDWKYKESIDLGPNNYNTNQLNKILTELHSEFPSNEYNLIHKNCNHFTNTVANKLGCNKLYPAYINRAASLGSLFVSNPNAGIEIARKKAAEESKLTVFDKTTGYSLSTVNNNNANTKSTAKDPAAVPAAVKVNPWSDPNFKLSKSAKSKSTDTSIPTVSNSSAPAASVTVLTK